MNLEFYLIGIGAILFISIFSSKLSTKFGIPLLLIFLILGMLMGSEGILGIEFDNPQTAQIIGTIALLFILYDGGLSTNYSHIKPILLEGSLLATFGVLITALAIAFCAHLFLDFTLLESFLLGAIVSSTDAAAVFSILRAKKLALKNNIGNVLELESGSNDPMAIFLTLTILNLIGIQNWEEFSFWMLAWEFILQFALGIGLGFLFGILFPKICHFAKISHANLYALLSVAWLLLMYGFTSSIGGNGFLCIYIAGILIHRSDFPFKQNVLDFHDTLAWMMQIIVFLVLGLLVFPSELFNEAIPALILTFLLIFFARPLGVFLSLIKSRYNFKEKCFISWVGLRGAVPIVLATYPYLEGLQKSHQIFNIVFFMVFISVFIQGMTLSPLANKLKIIEE
ncbi:potassium/proton antiporter [Helicobacter kayseriensis]|uniref:potassium/proton antiporter n=1 Tax=Helicobacter kayseriensis TaxID=2905877 RepID=UPI001E3270A0|nr:potassium/proton antiporter [Helicobacter kayseriensis]MCE3047620.1 potassium/proton antiporter [Helicobacter kayseriensis]MCE3049028.1 potassium/proton antiporter [Helicobacter kayseriensis]